LSFETRTITVLGDSVEFDIRDGFPITDISDDMSKVASQMAWWGAVHAAAEREKIEVDAHYRAWRARETENFLKQDSKLSVDKLRAKVEALPEFLRFKKALAQAEENVILARSAFEALSKKGNMLQSRGAMEREERGKIGIRTTEGVSEQRSVPPPSASDSGAENSVSRMREIVSKKKKKG